MSSATGVGGLYYLRLKVGDTPIGINPSTLNGCNVITDINRFLPYFQLSLSDHLGVLTHMKPTDSRFNKISLSFNRENYVERIFEINRETPEAITQSQSDFNCEGLLSLKNLFSPSFTRGFPNKSFGDIVRQISTEIGCDDVDIGATANSIKIPIYQPNCSNAKFLNYLKSKAGFYCFVVFRANKNILVFKTIDELLRNDTIAEFIYTDTNLTADIKAAYNLQIFNNTGILKDEGIYNQAYSYFDYTTGEHVFKQINVNSLNMLSLSDFYMVTEEDKNVYYQVQCGGSEPYSPIVKMESTFKNRLNDLVKIWIDVDGDFSLEAGKIIKLKFLYGAGGDLFSYQYSGYWLIERVIQSYGEFHSSRLLLKRPGVSLLTKDSAFIKPTKIKRTD